ncbi:MAG: CoxG family protein, partial [Thermoplasmata archaeon]
MPEGKIEFDVIAPVAQVWSFLSDLRKVGQCVPGVENVELIDEKRARWDLKVRIGPLSQT